MPYIKPEDRPELDRDIDQLAAKIVLKAKAYGYDGAFAGLLNYTCTELAGKIIKAQFGAIRYWLIAIVTGVFKNIADEFYRRTGVPYEDLQIKNNGDVSVYKTEGKNTRVLEKLK